MIRVKLDYVLIRDEERFTTEDTEDTEEYIKIVLLSSVFLRVLRGKNSILHFTHL